MKGVTISALLFICVSIAQCGNILIVFPFPSVSHHILGEQVARGLLKKGHHVTMITNYRVKDKLENYTEVILNGPTKWKEESLNKLISFNASKLDMFSVAFSMSALSNITLSDPPIQALLKSDKTFDAVVLNPLISDALLGLSHFYHAPTIILNTQGSMFLVNAMVGNSQPFAYVPNAPMASTDEMTFFERVKNTIYSLSMQLILAIAWLPSQDRTMHQHFPDAPPLLDLFQNVSLVLLNAHFSVVETPRPYMPNMIQVGGLHVQPQALPEDLKKYLDGAKDGVVLFSLGSNVKSADLPREKLDAIVASFAKFPQKFLWKFESDQLVVPDNVKISKWLPQRAVLEHPNVKAFITHGGLLSITEAVYYGVPFIGIPAFADQEYNIKNAAHRKIAVAFNMNNMNQEAFTAAIKEIIENPIYTENMKRHSSLLRDQPVAPLDLAVYWIEHVMQYKGAPHLRSAGLKLSWFQAYLLDVLAFIGAAVVVLVYVNFLIVRACIRFGCRKLFSKRKLKSN